MTSSERAFVEKLVRRKQLFLWLSVAGIVVAAGIALQAAIQRWSEPSASVGPHVVIVVLVLLNSRQNLRQHKLAKLLEPFLPSEPALVPQERAR